MIRTWAVWKQNRRVGFALGLLWLVILALCLFTDISFLKSLRGELVNANHVSVFDPAVLVLPAPYPGYRGCTVSSEFNVRGSGDKTALGMIVLDMGMWL